MRLNLGLLVQLVGCVVIAALASILSFLAFTTIKHAGLLRTRPEAEVIGSDQLDFVPPSAYSNVNTFAKRPSTMTLPRRMSKSFGGGPVDTRLTY